MRIGRRGFSAWMVGVLFGGPSGVLAREARSAADESAAFPGLSRLAAALVPDRAACVRLCEAGLATAFDGRRLAALEQRVAARLAKGGQPLEAIWTDLKRDDFRGDRTVVVGGFVLAETEAGAALVRARPQGA